MRDVIIVFFTYTLLQICLGVSDPALEQLAIWKQAHQTILTATDANGIPYPSLTATKAVSTDGPPLMEDRSLLERTQSFNRERIQERVVHAKGPGAHGTLTLTHCMSAYTKADFLNTVGKRTPLFLRFSLTSGEGGYPDTIRDARGFAVKFFTKEGNHDIAGNQIEVFNVRDPQLFADVNRSRKRNPQTHLKDPIMFWDFIQQRPESTLHILKVFSDAGSAESLRMVNGSGVHTFKLVNSKGDVHYCKFHFLSHQKFEMMSNARATTLAGTNPNWYQHDLYNSIASNKFPKWTLAMQIATPDQAEKYRWNYLDITKNWRFEDFPLIPVGIVELNRNPPDFFTANEQSAFSPANMVPGIEPSADRMLAARMFSYPDAQRYRLGVNYNQLQINRPVVPVASYERDGVMCMGPNGAGGPNYHPNSFNGPEVDPSAKQKPFFLSGEVTRIDSKDADNFSQPKLYVDKDILPDERQRIANNIGTSLSKVVTPAIRELVLQNNFYPISKTFGDQVRAALEVALRTPTVTITPRAY